MAASESGQLDLETTRNQFTKTFSVFDISSRLITLYEAATDTANGKPCMKTEFTYDGTSTRILKTKESRDAWNSSWDL